MKTPKYTPTNTFEQQVKASKQGWVIKSDKKAKSNKISNKEKQK
jgi:hypothetical protein